MMYYLLLGLHLLKFKTCVTVFYMFFWYLYWYQVALFFRYPYNLCVVDPALVVLELLVWLSTCPSVPLHLLLPDHLYNTSKALSYCALHPLCLANLQLYCFLDAASVHHALMPAVFALLIWIPGCLSHLAWHLFWCPYPWWACLSLPCGCVGTTSLQWKLWGQAYI